MGSCDMCGQQATTTARIEGVVMSVCKNCASFGNEFKPPSYVVKPVRRDRSSHAPQTEKLLIVHFGQAIRQARQKRGLTEEDAARALAITKTALLHYESGKYPPDDKVAKKLEKFYGITLFE